MHDRQAEDQRGERILQGFVRRYTAALTLLAVLAMAKFAWFEVLGIEDGQTQNLVATATRQRILAQRVAIEALRIGQAEDPGEAAASRRDLGDALERMELEHLALTSRSPSAAFPAPEGALSRLYFEEGLADRVGAYLELAHRVQETSTGLPPADDAALVALDRAADRALFDGLERAVYLYEQQATDARWMVHLVNTGSFLAVLAILGVLAFQVFGPMAQTLREEARRVSEAERHQVDAVRRNAFTAQLHSAFDMVQTEEDVLDLVENALKITLPNVSASLLLSDPSHAHLRPAASTPTTPARLCSVEGPMKCAAIRRGHLLRFDSSEDLDACPRLRDPGRERSSAMCIPLAFLGEPLGVLHVTGEVGAAPDGLAHERLEALASQAANRLGTVRSFDLIREQAATDPLTGLMNRRALEGLVRRLSAAHTPFAVVMADVDRFKHLNDTYGHEVGDQALRLYARVLRESVRAEDAVARHGGEEFVLLLPGATAEVAATTADRVRTRLGGALAGSALPAFTASYGVADSTTGARFSEVQLAADQALLCAKRAGRDRIALAPAENATTALSRSAGRASA